jgi:hypothetical protein
VEKPRIAGCKDLFIIDPKNNGYPIFHFYLDLHHSRGLHTTIMTFDKFSKGHYFSTEKEGNQTFNWLK